MEECLWSSNGRGVWNFVLNGNSLNDGPIRLIWRMRIPAVLGDMKKGVVLVHSVGLCCFLLATNGMWSEEAVREVPSLWDGL